MTRHIPTRTVLYVCYRRNIGEGVSDCTLHWEYSARLAGRRAWRCVNVAVRVGCCGHHQRLQLGEVGVGMAWLGRESVRVAEPEPEPEVELVAQLEDLALGETAHTGVSAAWPTGTDATRLETTPRPLQPPALGSSVSASTSRIVDITDCHSEPAQPSLLQQVPHLIARTGRKGSILDMITQLSPVLMTNTEAQEPMLRTPLEGFVLDTNVRPESRKPLKQPEVWDPMTRTWQVLQTLGACSKSGGGQTRRGSRAGCRGTRAGFRSGNRCAKSDVACSNETNSRLLLWVSTNRGSIRRGSKRASRAAGGRGRSAQPCV